MKQSKVTTAREYKITRLARELNCSRCPPNKGDNCKHKKHSVKKKRGHRE
jgi:hypothetical protein